MFAAVDRVLFSVAVYEIDVCMRFFEHVVSLFLVNDGRRSVLQAVVC